MTDPCRYHSRLQARIFVDGSMDIVFKLDNANFKFKPRTGGRNGRWELPQDKFRYIWEDDTFTKNGALDYTFTLNGNGQPEDPEKGQCEIRHPAHRHPAQAQKVSILKCVTYHRAFSLFSTAASSRPRKMRWPQSKAPAISYSPIVFSMGNETVTYI